MQRLAPFFLTCAILLSVAHPVLAQQPEVADNTKTENRLLMDTVLEKTLGDVVLSTKLEMLSTGEISRKKFEEFRVVSLLKNAASIYSYEELASDSIATTYDTGDGFYYPATQNYKATHLSGLSFRLAGATDLPSLLKLYLDHRDIFKGSDGVMFDNDESTAFTDEFTDFATRSLEFGAKHMKLRKSLKRRRNKPLVAE